MAEITKRIRIIAGPNGSGKSTLYKLVQNKVPTGPFVNADLIGKLLTDIAPQLRVRQFSRKLPDKIVCRDY
jgi:predicted ABC-type ATPase